LNFIRAPELLSECKQSVTLADIGADTKHESPVVVVCATCRPKLPTEKKQLPVYFKSLGYGKHIEEDIAAVQHMDTIMSMMIKDLGKAPPPGVTKDMHNRFRTNGLKWMSAFNKTQWTPEKIKSLELSGDHTWESKYHHWAQNAFDCAIAAALASVDIKPKMIQH